MRIATSATASKTAGWVHIRAMQSHRECHHEDEDLSKGRNVKCTKWKATQVYYYNGNDKRRSWYGYKPALCCQGNDAFTKMKILTRISKENRIKRDRKVSIMVGKPSLRDYYWMLQFEHPERSPFCAKSLKG